MLVGVSLRASVPVVAGPRAPFVACVLAGEVFTWPFCAVPLKVGRVILLLAAPATLDVPVVPWLMAFMLPWASVAWFAASRFAGRLVAVVPRLAVTTPRLVA